MRYIPILAILGNYLKNEWDLFFFIFDHKSIVYFKPNYNYKNVIKKISVRNYISNVVDSVNCPVIGMDRRIVNCAKTKHRNDTKYQNIFRVGYTYDEDEKRKVEKLKINSLFPDRA